MNVTAQGRPWRSSRSCSQLCGHAGRGPGGPWPALGCGAESGQPGSSASQCGALTARPQGLSQGPGGNMPPLRGAERTGAARGVQRVRAREGQSRYPACPLWPGQGSLGPLSPGPLSYGVPPFSAGSFVLEWRVLDAEASSCAVPVIVIVIVIGSLGGFHCPGAGGPAMRTIWLPQPAPGSPSPPAGVAGILGPPQLRFWRGSSWLSELPPASFISISGDSSCWSCWNALPPRWPGAGTGCTASVAR